MFQAHLIFILECFEVFVRALAPYLKQEMRVGQTLYKIKMSIKYIINEINIKYIINEINIKYIIYEINIKYII